MNRLRSMSVAAVVVTYLQLTLGGIVRISGAGMGCGDHWPKCNGSWIPPFTDALVMIEWTHRLMALLVVVTITALVWMSRREPRVKNASVLALTLVISVAMLGMLTVKLGNTALATVGHWTLAMALLGVLVATAVRTGALGGALAAAQGGTPRAVRSLGAGAALAFVVVVLGGLVAKTAGAAAACPSFPLCGETPAGISSSATTLQLTHRALAFLLVFHLAMTAIAIGGRPGESSATRRAAATAALVAVIQLGIAAAMILGGMPAGLRAAHQAVGVGVWLVIFTAAYLARTAASKQRTADG